MVADPRIGVVFRPVVAAENHQGIFVRAPGGVNAGRAERSARFGLGAYFRSRAGCRGFPGVSAGSASKTAVPAVKGQAAIGQIALGAAKIGTLPRERLLRGLTRASIFWVAIFRISTLTPVSSPPWLRRRNHRRN